jgi:predicted PurR-regulated permease PerM
MDMMGIVALYIFITLTAAVLFSFAFWLWMLADFLKRRNLKRKMLWFLIILVLNLIGAVIYFLIVKNKKK